MGRGRLKPALRALGGSGFSTLHFNVTLIHQEVAMSEQNDPPINPYAAPESPLEAAPVSLDANLAEIEATRRKYLNHEASVKSVGSLHILGGIFTVFAVIMVLADPITRAQQGMGFAIFLTFLMMINLGIGFGLTKLQPWARWVDAAFFCIGILMNIASFAIVLLVAPGAYRVRLPGI